MTPDDIQELMDYVHDRLYLAEPGAPAHGGGSSGDQMPFNEKLADTMRELHATLASWALMVAEEQPRTIDCEDESMSIIGWLAQSRLWLCGHPAVDDFVSEVRLKTTQVRRCVDRGDDRMYLGVHAGHPVYVSKDNSGEYPATVVLPDGRAGAGHALYGFEYHTRVDTCSWGTRTTRERLAEALPWHVGRNLRFKRNYRYTLTWGEYTDGAVIWDNGDGFPVEVRRLYLNAVSDAVVVETSAGQFFRVA